MRTGAKFQSNSSYLKNMVRQSADGASAAKGVSRSSLDVHRGFRPCDVIYEEPASDVQVDDNGNESHKEEETSMSNKLFTNVNNNNNDIENNIQENGQGNNNKNLRITSSGVISVNESMNENCDDFPLTTRSWSPSQRFSSSRSRLSNNLKSAVSTSSVRTTSETSLSDGQSMCHVTNDNLPEVMSGHLVLVVSNQNRKFTPLKSNSLSPTSSRTLTQSRFPVIVKIYGRGCGKYVIISSTRRQQALPSSCLKLKNTYVTQSTTDPSRFTLSVDSADGKSFTFEASNPEKAKEWMQAFSPDSSQPRSDSQHPKEDILQPGHHVTSESKLLTHPLNLSHLPLLPVLSESLDEEDEE